MELKGKLIIILVIFLIGLSALFVGLSPHKLTVTGKLVLKPHPVTGEYTPMIMVWTLETKENKTYYLLDSQKRMLSSTEDGAFSEFEGLNVTIGGYNITFLSYDGNQTFDGLVVKKIAGKEWSG